MAFSKTPNCHFNRIAYKLKLFTNLKQKIKG
jgi:hypothetical protein